MPRLPHPGVVEPPSSVHAITGVATSIGAFFGQAERGPLDTPIECASTSDYVRAFGGSVPNACLAQSVRQFFDNGGSDCFVVRVASGAAPAQPPGLTEYQGDPLARTGFHALDDVDLFNLMVVPGDGIAGETEWQAVRRAAAVYCQSRRAFLILDAPAGWTQGGQLIAQVGGQVQDFRNAIGDPDINCAVYYPRVQFNDDGVLRYIGASGMIAGVYAATVASHGVWKAPAGANAALTGVTGLEVTLTDAQNGILNPLGVNCLRRMPAGYLVWGARTAAGFDNSGTQWTYVPVRRMALFLEESLYRGTQWVVFEPNGEPLWSQIRMTLDVFMMGLFAQGAFQGSTPSEAFFVKCDSETTTQADIDQGVVNIIVGFASLQPAEFVVITIQQTVQGQGCGPRHS